MNETRTTFAGLPTWTIVLWYGLIVVSTGVFAAGVLVLVAKWRRGRADGVGGPLRPRLRRALVLVGKHRTIRRGDPLVGAAHALVFYGFLLLLAGTTILAIQDDLLGPIGVRFWHGAFYLGYSLVLDVAGLALVVGLGLLAWRRGLLRPPRLDYARADAACSDSARGATCRATGCSCSRSASWR